MEYGLLTLHRSSWVEQTPFASTLASGICVLSIGTWLDQISRVAWFVVCGGDGVGLNLLSRKLERGDTEREKEAIQLRERVEKGYRVHGWDKLERPVSVVEP